MSLTPSVKSAYTLAAVSVVFTMHMPAIAQQGRISDPQQAAATIDCRQWKLNSDGTWSSGPNARVGNLTFPNTMNNTMSGYTDNGLDAETLLEKKCGHR